MYQFRYYKKYSNYIVISHGLKRVGSDCVNVWFDWCCLILNNSIFQTQIFWKRDILSFF